MTPVGPLLRGGLLLLLAVAGACRELPLPQNQIEGRQGYVSRPCGFDLDHDGIFGEAEDCRLCDGKTTDPDGDGVAEDLLYVDCEKGHDAPTCGLPSSPCASLEFAFEKRADGPADGAEDVVCFRGVCRPQELEPSFGGVAGTYVLPPEGHAVAEWLLPQNPARLAGWDADGDGEYPPHDPDDTAVLDGSGGKSFAFRLGSRNSFFEMAHFEARDYGRGSTKEQSGFLAFGSPKRTDDPALAHRADAFFFHDLRLAGINAGEPAQGHRIVFNYFTRATRFHHVLFRNLDLKEIGGFMVRGSGPDRPGSEAEGGNDGPFRWQNLSLTARGCNHSDPACVAGGGSAFIGWKLWGYIDGIEVLDSHFDANVAAWEPKPDGNGGALFVNATQCSRGWTIRGNHLQDFKVALIAQGGNGNYCGYDTTNVPPRRVPRPTADVVFADNVFWNTYVPWRSGDMIVQLKGGEDQNRTLGEVKILNNVLASSDGFDACIRVDVNNAGASPPGKVSILGNTCWGSRAQGRATGLWIGSSRALPFVQENVELRGNVFAGFGPEDLNIRFDTVPRQLVSADNVFDPEAPFELGGKKWPTLEELGKNGLELGSSACEPAFEDAARGLFGRRAGDACGR